MKRIYLDNAASTPVDPRVIEAMFQCTHQQFGNASSLHEEGNIVERILEDARALVAGLLRCSNNEIYFTSGGTESNNWALKGFAFGNIRKGKHIIISDIEHDCILNTCHWLQQQGFRISFLKVDSDGLVDPDDFKKLICRDTILVSVMHVNNEIGTIQPLSEIGAIAHEHNIAFHTDACQSFGKINVLPDELNADMISINSHKIYGPKGVGALYIRKGICIDPLFHGGGQEKGLRSGTENIPAIAGFGKAVELCGIEMINNLDHVNTLALSLLTSLENAFPSLYLNGSRTKKIPGILNVGLTGLEGEAIRLLLLLDERGFAVSTGSACSSNHHNHTGSRILTAIGRNPVEARGALRLSIGKFNTQSDIEAFLNVLPGVVQELHPIFSI